MTGNGTSNGIGVTEYHKLLCARDAFGIELDDKYIKLDGTRLVSDEPGIQAILDILERTGYYKVLYFFNFGREDDLQWLMCGSIQEKTDKEAAEKRDKLWSYLSDIEDKEAEEIKKEYEHIVEISSDEVKKLVDYFMCYDVLVRTFIKYILFGGTHEWRQETESLFRKMARGLEKVQDPTPFCRIIAHLTSLLKLGDDWGKSYYLDLASLMKFPSDIDASIGCMRDILSSDEHQLERLKGARTIGAREREYSITTSNELEKLAKKLERAGVTGVEELRNGIVNAKETNAQGGSMKMLDEIIEQFGKAEGSGDKLYGLGPGNLYLDIFYRCKQVYRHHLNWMTYVRSQADVSWSISKIESNARALTGVFSKYREVAAGLGLDSWIIDDISNRVTDYASRMGELSIKFDYRIGTIDEYKERSRAYGIDDLIEEEIGGDHIITQYSIPTKVREKLKDDTDFDKSDFVIRMASEGKLTGGPDSKSMYSIIQDCEDTEEWKVPEFDKEQEFKRELREALSGGHRSKGRKAQSQGHGHTEESGSSELSEDEMDEKLKEALVRDGLISESDSIKDIFKEAAPIEYDISKIEFVDRRSAEGNSQKEVVKDTEVDRTTQFKLFALCKFFGLKLDNNYIYVQNGEVTSHIKVLSDLIPVLEDWQLYLLMYMYAFGSVYGIQQNDRDAAENFLVPFTQAVGALMHRTAEYLVNYADDTPEDIKDILNYGECFIRSMLITLRLIGGEHCVRAEGGTQGLENQIIETLLERHDIHIVRLLADIEYKMSRPYNTIGLLDMLVKKLGRDDDICLLITLMKPLIGDPHEYLRKCLELAKDVQAPEVKITLGLAYHDVGESEKALGLFLDAIDLIEKSNNSHKIDNASLCFSFESVALYYTSLSYIACELFVAGKPDEAWRALYKGDDIILGIQGDQEDTMGYREVIDRIRLDDPFWKGMLEQMNRQALRDLSIDLMKRTGKLITDFPKPED